MRAISHFCAAARRLHSYTTSQLCGYTATQLHSFTAPRLHDSTAPRFHSFTPRQCASVSVCRYIGALAHWRAGVPDRFQAASRRTPQCRFCGAKFARPNASRIFHFPVLRTLRAAHFLNLRRFGAPINITRQMGIARRNNTARRNGHSALKQKLRVLQKFGRTEKFYE